MIGFACWVTDEDSGDQDFIAAIEFFLATLARTYRSICSNNIGGWMPYDHCNLPFTLVLAKHIGCADGF
jgi:hypothetical protein